MQSTEFEDAKLLWKMFYAQQCFKRAHAVAEHILKEKLEKENPLFYPLMTSLFVIYGRPFKRARGVGHLGDEMIPAQHSDLHRTLLQHRDQVYAHTDAEAFDLADFGEANQVRVLRTLMEMRLFATDFHARYPLMPSIIDLCATLQVKTGYHVDKLFNRYMGRVPQPVGEYGINVTDSNGDFFTKEKPMLLR
jgi:hypothetical protein